MPRDQALITPRLAGSRVPRVTHCNASNTFDDSAVGLAEFEIDYDVPAFATGVTRNANLATLLPDAKVPAGHKVVVTDFHIYFAGPTAWNNITSMVIRDSAPSGQIDLLTVNAAQTAQGTLIVKQSSAISGVTWGAGLASLGGCNTGRGLVLYLNGSSDPTEGSGFKIHLKGFFKKA